ncbi:MAG: acyl carrier protein [Planctomycetota bacterium]|jgi:acyl carrier protein
MDINQILKEVSDIFIDILDEDDIVLARDTTADDIEEWDSLTHIQLIVAIEKHFKIKFTSSEIQNFKDVGEMCDKIVERV